MGRPRIYDTPHFCLHTYVRKGHTYVEAYRNEWDPEKKRSRIAQRKYVGVLDTTTGRVRLGKKYLSENPQYEGKILYYEDKQLVERTPEEVQEELDKRVPSPPISVAAQVASLISLFNCSDIVAVQTADEVPDSVDRTIMLNYNFHCVKPPKHTNKCLM